MKQVVSLAGAFLLAASVAFAAGPKSYQVTGPVLEIKEDVIVVEKGKERWEIGRGKDTKVVGNLQVGSKVTVEYRMEAASVEVKEGKAKEAKK